MAAGPEALHTWRVILARRTVMETFRDPRGLAVSAANAAALAAAERALEALLGSRGDVGRHVDEALRCDPQCVLATCIRVAARLLRGTDEIDALRRALAIANIPAYANDRERRHVSALRAWLAGDRHEARARYGALLIDYPRDILALHVAHALDFRLGPHALLHERVAQVLPHWHAGIPQFGYVLGMHAFGLEEAGDYARAERAARRSLELLPDNAAAMHVIAHVYEMQGRASDGIAFLDATRSTWASNPGFAIHIAWHLALFHIDRDDAPRALDIYDRVLRPSASSGIAALVDASALLWRLDLRGVDGGARWSKLAKCWRRKPLRGGRAFNLTHAMMAFVGARCHRRADRVLDLLRNDPHTRASNEPQELALALRFCEALRAFGHGDHRLAIQKLAAMRTQMAQCGGSIAQCDLIHLTFIEAALRSRSARLARVLAAERSSRRPQSRLDRWLFWRADAVGGLA